VGYLDLADRTWPLLTRVMGLHTLAYRATGGLIGKRIPGVKAPMLLLDHVGAKSGIKRTVPLLYIADGEAVAIIASKGGFTKHPAWYHNLRANPDTTVQIGREKREVHARLAADGEERERIWNRAVELWPQYAAYQARTERRIPVIVLDRRDVSAPPPAATKERMNEEQPQTTEPPSDRPDENTAPPSNPDIDPERVEKSEEDVERAVPG
jgi:deazaflavin-dependent oxidoreductase (nitroreductase family)